MRVIAQRARQQNPLQFAARQTDQRFIQQVFAIRFSRQFDNLVIGQLIVQCQTA